jgi:hypothetical protein
MSKSYKFVQRSPKSLDSLISDGVQELTDLGEECRNASDNFPNSSHPKAEAFGEVADVLENVEAPGLDDLPDELVNEQLAWNESIPKDKRRQASRDVRRTNAVGQLEIARDRLNEWADEQETSLEEAKETDEENAEEVAEASPGAIALVESMRKELEEQIAKAREVAEELDEIIGNTSDLEFPGLYG